MPAPRMRIGIFGDSAAGQELAAGLAAAGHALVRIDALTDCAEVDALILAIHATQLPRAVEAVETYIANGQIVIHTALAAGVQVLDPLETRGAVVVAAAPVSVNRWAVTTLDELGETIAGLLLGEMGATAIAKTDAERATLASRVAYAKMLARLTADARREVELLMDEETQPGADIDPAEVIDGYRYIHEPGLRRSYLEVARRFGEVEEAEDIEMWALQEENR
ncbi:hypothetical protein HMPREF2976_01945 [Corynebacterium sp. HMSC077D10]|uniref:Uncharacterized protein n=1 Tax=Corynebacterium phoceense TaxID=1686286 RepID=A0A540R5L5_9CORY|nr:MULTISPECIES: hypothetical protein [Corynebacterium]KXB52315.1 hypothetical protein HMPREF0307_02380 [Corynebacterium sp. DNF00584]OFL80054.1 hypothetical protein HMPREF2748_07795 [Corynebacterium sp. HMSC077B05]OFP19650.1 hypothetical protein HMPREF2998_09000 [Corynebacterium sp. HMSC065A05]OFP68274.1 hypothetical protein HMPREF2976_01945 [Corynebacterium sp. HMSC077D10]TQE43035.1 hypothetical protein EJK80_09175 [Corynebacterium phoceense]